MIGKAVEKLLRRAIVAGSGADCETFSPIGGLWLLGAHLPDLKA
jgi:hypothetical protein